LPPELETMATKTIPGRVNIKACEIEFINGGNTIWVHSPLGGTVLRIKCSGEIKTEACTNSPISHGDILVHGDINFCVSTDLND